MADIKRSTTRRIKGIASLLLSALTTWSVSADDFADGIDRNDPNFVKASLIVASPGNAFFGCAGHSALRLECPTFQLDNCFSCESEPIGPNMFRFFMGNLKMGMVAMPTADFLKGYQEEGRGVRQYPLTLPPAIKQRLWKIMDERVAEGFCLHYDYIKYCCVQSVLMPILESIHPIPIEYPVWPESYSLSRREILANLLAWCPWTRFFLHTIAGTEVDRMVSPVKTVILSPDLVDLLKGMKLGDESIIQGECEELVVQERSNLTVWFTPMKLMICLLILAISSWFVDCRWIDWTFLTIQSVIGLLLTHLLVLSNLPATSWNWLIVPFNLFPLILWRFRRWWAWLMVVILVVWDGVMLFYPHQLTDSAYIVLVLAYIIFYAKICFSVSHSLPRQNHPPGNNSRVGSCFVRG